MNLPILKAQFINSFYSTVRLSSSTKKAKSFGIMFFIIERHTRSAGISVGMKDARSCMEYLFANKKNNYMLISSLLCDQ